MFFIRFGKFSSSFLQYFSYPFLSFVISIMQMLLYEWCSISPSGSIYFLSLFFFLLLRIVSIVLSSSSLIISSVYSNLMLHPSHEFFFFVIVFSSFKISVWFLFIIFIIFFIDILIFLDYFYFLLFFPMVSFGSLTIVNVVNLISLTNNFYVLFSSGMVSVKFFFFLLWLGHTFLFFVVVAVVCFVYFVFVVVENWTFWVLCLDNSGIQFLPFLVVCWFFFLRTEATYLWLFQIISSKHVFLILCGHWCFCFYASVVRQWP